MHTLNVDGYFHISPQEDLPLEVYERACFPPYHFQILLSSGAYSQSNRMLLKLLVCYGYDEFSVCTY